MAKVVEENAEDELVGVGESLLSGGVSRSGVGGMRDGAGQSMYLLGGGGGAGRRGSGENNKVRVGGARGGGGECESGARGKGALSGDKQAHGGAWCGVGEGVVGGRQRGGWRRPIGGAESVLTAGCGRAQRHASGRVRRWGGGSKGVDEWAMRDALWRLANGAHDTCASLCARACADGARANGSAARRGQPFKISSAYLRS